MNLVKYEELKDINEYSNWEVIRKINKGWSQDKKYYIKHKDGQELLLRISSISNFAEKQQEYNNLCEISNININMSLPIDFGTCSNNTLVYMLLTWVSGNDAEIALPNLSEEKQYKLGVESGKMLKAIHSIPAPKTQRPWSERFNAKIDRNIRNYNSCAIVIPYADKIIQYINDNRYLLEDREQTMQHGDYHTGNLVITETNKIGVIDFNRNDFGDPWEEFNRIVFSVHVSIPFAIGQINGYFNNSVPDKFFKLMALYISANSISSVAWAIPFGQKEVDTMLNNINEMLEYYNKFNTYKPTWYKSSHQKIG